MEIQKKHAMYQVYKKKLRGLKETQELLVWGTGCAMMLVNKKRQGPNAGAGGITPSLVDRTEGEQSKVEQR